MTEEISKIFSKICEVRNVPMEQILENTRVKEYAHERKVCIYLLYITTGLPLRGIVKVFPRELSVINKSVNYVKDRIEWDSTFNAQIEHSKSLL
jgi:chromosomal replication initiation ATPase DnaA